MDNLKQNVDCVVVLTVCIKIGLKAAKNETTMLGQGWSTVYDAGPTMTQHFGLLSRVCW